jgi:hypothetical protein
MSGIGVCEVEMINDTDGWIEGTSVEDKGVTTEDKEDVKVLEVSVAEDTDTTKELEAIDRTWLDVWMEAELAVVIVVLCLVADGTTRDVDEDKGLLIDEMLDNVLERVFKLLDESVVLHRPYFAWHELGWQ